jgi:hypothetical protein
MMIVVLFGGSSCSLGRAGCSSPDIEPGSATDVSDRMQSFFDALDDGSCVAFPRSRPGRQVTYRIDAGIALRGHRGLTIHGNGVRFFTERPGPLDQKTQRSQRAMVRVVGGERIRIEDVTLDGPNGDGRYAPAYEEEAGFRLSGVQQAVIENVRVRQVFGDAISVYELKRSGRRVPSRDVVISRPTGELIGRQGVAVTAAQGVTIEDGFFRGIARSVFDLEPLAGRSVADVRIERNTVDGYRNTFVAGLGAGNKRDIVISANRSLSSPMRIKMVADSVTVANNSGGGLATVPFVQINAGDDITVVGNKQAFHGPGVKCPPNCGSVAVALRGEVGSACDSYVAGNVFTGARALFVEHLPSPPCTWVDGGRNEI